MENVARKMYQESKSTQSVEDSDCRKGPGARALSALELHTAAAGRSNLAALLRTEAVRRKFEIETARRIAEQHRKAEMRQRDRLLRSKPAWHLVKNKYVSMNFASRETRCASMIFHSIRLARPCIIIPRTIS